MFTLKCEYCGFEQTIKKRIDKYTYYELTHCKHLWCPCNKCKETHPRPIGVKLYNQLLKNVNQFSKLRDIGLRMLQEETNGTT